MTDEYDAIKSVSQLSQYTFHVPAYQRGYRWTDAEVKDLLNDIRSFSPADIPGSTSKTWYCLQPLVVRKREDLGDQTYEIIDGQQRITTILLIGRYINEMWRGKEKDPELRLEYESRYNTATFLDELLVSDDEQSCVDHSNIDFSHISIAYQTIAGWMRTQTDFKRDEFINTFLHYVRVIWYEPAAADSISIFTRLNMGKIALTDAELIKALFLNSSNFGNQSSVPEEAEKIRLKQLEIAGEWDRMEAALHNSEFWYFLNEKGSSPATRIDFVFNLLTDNQANSETYHIFREYSSGFKTHTTKEVEDKWCEVKRCFQTLEEWYSDRELYHKIGYLIETGASIIELYRLSKNKLKSDFVKKLDEKISARIPDDTGSLEYGDPAIRNVLLLHNIQTMLNNKVERSRFPFDRFKAEKGWDVEHIHSVSEDVPKTDQHQQDWLSDAQLYLSNEELKKNIKAVLAEAQWDREAFKRLYAAVLDSYADGEKESDINDISNLALLDSKTNRGYGNAVFPVKRSTIIEHEKQGTFVPICTKNVFMKFYSKEVENFTFWCEADREYYLADIQNVLGVFKKETK